ncbi:MAG: hypothetical protein RJA99_1999 [Pseudomonadota bacterium]|jgi:predicted Zn finger-like uncharacterized protein
MALATTCPQCKTSFKVVPDQLKLRRGLVRCGVCQHVFSGIDYLRYVDDAARAAQRAARERGAAQGAAPAGAGAATPGRGGPAAVPPTIAAPGTTGPGTTGPGFAGSLVSAPGAGAGDAPGSGTGGGLVTASGGISGAFERTASPDAGSGSTWPAAGSTTITVPSAAPAPLPTTSSPPPAFRAQAEPSSDASAAFPHAPPAPSPGSSVEPLRALPPGMDPWAAAAHAVHERSLRDDPPVVDPFALAASIVAPSAPPTSDAFASPQVDSPAPSPLPEPASRQAEAPAQPAVHAPASTEAAAPAGGQTTAGAPATAADRASNRAPDGLPALPAPAEARRPPTPDLDELLARPTRPWPPAEGPQTIIPADEDLKTAFFLPDTAIGPVPADAGAAPREPVEPDPITLLRPEGRPASEDGPHLDPHADTLVPEPPPVALAPRAPHDADAAIDYFPGRRVRSRGLGLALSPAAWAAAAVLSLLLGLQAVVGWRDGIAARAPWLAPVLGAMLSPFGAEPRPPRDLDALTIEGFELQAAGAPDALQLSAVLRNRSGHVVGFPAMELTLTDSAGALLVRKVIPAEAYLPDALQREAGLPGGTERPLKLALEHGGLQPTGYTVALFYP